MVSSDRSLEYQISIFFTVGLVFRIGYLYVKFEEEISFERLVIMPIKFGKTKQEEE